MGNIVDRQAAGQPLKDTSFLDRMQDELKELSVKITKLSEFFASGRANNLPGIDQDLLYAQHDTMRGYRRILAIRIERARGYPIAVSPIDTAGEILDDGIRLAKPDPAEPLPFNG